MTVPIQMISRKVVTLSCLQTGPHGALLRKAGHSLARYIRAEETFGYCHIHYTVYAMCIACGTSDRPVCSETNPQPSFPPLRLGLRVTRKSEKNTCRNTVRTDGNESIAPSARGGPSGLPQVLRLHCVCVVSLSPGMDPSPKRSRQGMVQVCIHISVHHTWKSSFTLCKDRKEKHLKNRHVCNPQQRCKYR